MSAVPQPSMRGDPAPDPADGRFDESRGPDGALRPHWAHFFECLGTTHPARALARRDRRLQAHVREQGITYNVYGDAGGPTRRWSLDLLPFLISSEDWARIEAAVVQRAQLLSRILADIYGPQRLLARGLLPPALVLGNPRFLRPLLGAVPPGGHHLHLAAFDLARAPDGGWWVASQRTQAPSGLGYALENRHLVPQVFPEAFSELRVRPLAPDFRGLVDALARLAPEDTAGTGAGIVLLTPGPYNETYFEHASLARNLGIPLVVGPDLTVRADRLYLKTLHGLRPVRAVLRRVDEAFCDPLELRADSALGVPGLLRCVRAGTVLIANSLGAGVVESHALHGFLPDICRALLGTPLLLPSRDTWWCGEQAARRIAFERLEKARVRPTWPGTEDASLEAAREFVSLAQWRERIESDPDAYTVQTHVPFSKTPGWVEGALAPRSALVRVYAYLDATGRWRAMPGGLTRIAQNNARISMQRGGSSADTWVLGGAADPASEVPGGTAATATDLADLRVLAPVTSAREIRPIPSRAAENLFWMGRYTERCANLVRFAQQALALLRGDEPVPAELATCITRIAVATGLLAAVPARPGAAALERELLAALSDPARSGIAFHAAALQQCALGIRERLSAEHWRAIRSICEALGSPAEGMPAQSHPPSLETALQDASLRLAAIVGAQTDAMTRDDGWRLLTVGRLIERISSVAGVLELLVAERGALAGAGFDFALALSDCTITYLAQHQGRRDPVALVDLIALEGANPRSLRACADGLAIELDRLAAATGVPRTSLPWPADAGWILPDTAGPFPAGPDVRFAGTSAGRVANPFAGAGAGGMPAAIATLARDLRARAHALSDALGGRFFTHSGASQILSS